jgi:hypothetical protein
MVLANLTKLVGFREVATFNIEHSRSYPVRYMGLKVAPLGEIETICGYDGHI